MRLAIIVRTTGPGPPHTGSGLGNVCEARGPGVLTSSILIHRLRPTYQPQTTLYPPSRTLKCLLLLAQLGRQRWKQACPVSRDNVGPGGSGWRPAHQGSRLASLPAWFRPWAGKWSCRRPVSLHPPLQSYTARAPRPSAPHGVALLPTAAGAQEHGGGGTAMLLEATTSFFQTSFY